MTNTSPADARRWQIRTVHAIFAGAATIATLALFSAAQPAGAATAAASFGAQTATSMGGGGGRVIAVNDDDPNNPSDGDIFTQNAQDQSTA